MSQGSRQGSRPGPGHFSLFTTAAVFGAPIGSETDDPHAADLTIGFVMADARATRRASVRRVPLRFTASAQRDGAASRGTERGPTMDQSEEVLQEARDGRALSVRAPAADHGPVVQYSYRHTHGRTGH